MFHKTAEPEKKQRFSFLSASPAGEKKGSTLLRKTEQPEQKQGFSFLKKAQPAQEQGFALFRGAKPAQNKKKKKKFSLKRKVLSWGLTTILVMVAVNMVQRVLPTFLGGKRTGWFSGIVDGFRSKK